MKKVLILPITLVVMFSSLHSVAETKKSSAMKVSKSGEALSKKNPAVITVNQNLAKAKKQNKNKVASK